MTKWILATLVEGAGYLSRSSAISNSLKNILWRFKCVKLENYDCVLSISVSTINGLKYSPVNAHRSGNIYNFSIFGHIHLLRFVVVTFQSCSNR